MNENMMKRLGDPKYDEDLVNLEIGRASCRERV